MNLLKNIRQVFLDMDGTIYHGSNLYPTTIPFLDFLDSHKIGYMFVSNNSSIGLKEYVEKLAMMGIQSIEDSFYTSTEYAVDYLKKNYPDVKRLFLLGTPSIIPAFENAGFRLDEETPQCVVVAFDKGLTYKRLCKAAWFLKKGVLGIATHPDVFCPSDEATWLVDCGAITKALEVSTGVKLNVLGKPDPGMLLAAAKRKKVSAKECLMIGDRLATDIAVGINAGMQTCRIVGPGADRTDVKGIHPDYTMKDLGELQKYWEQKL